MKKSKMTLGIMASILTCAALAGCDGAKYSPEGYILTYTNSAGEVTHYTADDLFSNYYNDSSKVSTMFDSIYKLIVRNYFNLEGQSSKLSEIISKAENDVDGIKAEAKKNADTNSTNYDDEWDALLESNGVDDEDELLEKFKYERMLEEFNKQFYENNIDHLRDGVPSEGDGYEGYIYKKAPYHVRHILVKLSDSGSTNFWNGTIDSSNASLLYNVVNALAKGQDSFGSVAQKYSDDSSASKFGDLGIMDKDTSYVNEFKLGVYAYENIYNNATKAAASTSEIAMSSDIKSDYESAANEASTGSIAKIPYGAFVKIFENKDVTKDDNNRDVNDGSATYYPRNIYYNKYLNIHSVGVITPDDVESGTNDYSTLAGFSEGDGSDGLGKILRTKDGQPILVVRAGTSDYQGIHFIVVQRTPLINEVNGVKLSEYYTTKYPGQSGYPTNSDKTNKQTYVNFLNQEVKDYKDRAEEVENKIKNFDSNLNKYIYATYVATEKIKFSDENLESQINKWIKNAAASVEMNADIDWDKTWNSYIETLKVQNDEREKLIPEKCAIGFKSHTGADWQLGGVCNDNKDHNY